MRKTIKIEVRRKIRMSQAGFDRLDRRAKVFFKREVYPAIFRGVVNTDNIYCEESLAKWLHFKFGEGYYVIHSWRMDSKGQKHYTKALVKVGIDSISENKFNYEFFESRNIARYSFWIPEYL